MYIKIIGILAIILLPSLVIAHSGGTDSSGGHNCNVGSCAGTYHYHNGGYTAPAPRRVPTPAPAPAPTVSQSYHNSTVKSLEATISSKAAEVSKFAAKISDLESELAKERDLKTVASLERDSAKAEAATLTAKLDGGLLDEIATLTDETKSLRNENSLLSTSVTDTKKETENAEGANMANAFGGAASAGILAWGVASYQAKRRKTGSIIGKPRIKGNISRDGEKIYHVPDGQYYNSVVINPKEGERYFKTVEDAEASGFVSVE